MHQFDRFSQIDSPISKIQSGEPPQRVAPDLDAVLRLSADPILEEHTVTGRMVLDVCGETIPVEVTIPAGPVTVEDILPIVYGLSSLFATRATAQSEGEGKPVTCRAGCGACCRQLVPVSAAEGRRLAQLVKGMPEPQRTAVRARFDAALDALEPLNLIDRLDGDESSRRAVGLEYFQAGIPCPFLEDEACSIHVERPMSCREYLVSSAPSHCATLGEGVRTLRLEATPSLALLNADLRDGWLPLVMALVHDAQAPPSPRERTGAEILKDVVARL